MRRSMSWSSVFRCRSCFARSMSSAYRLQQIYIEAHRSIQQASYQMTDVVFWLNGVTTYFGDAVLYERLLLKRYDDILPRLEKALGAH